MSHSNAMIRAQSRRIASFVVRFYGEVSREPQGWRGQVEHVQSGEKRAFHGAKELVRAMEGLAQRAGTLELSLKEQEE